MTILDELADYARVRAAEAKKKRSPEEVKKAALARRWSRLARRQRFLITSIRTAEYCCPFFILS